jgi:hypothetical protein
MISSVKGLFTFSAGITKYKGAPFNVRPYQLYLDQMKKRKRNSKYQFNDRRHLDLQNLHHIKKVINL